MKKKALFALLLILMLAFTLCACGEPKASAEYDANEVVIELPDGSTKVLTIGDLRLLDSHHLDGEYRRTTGTIDRFAMDGPYVKEILASVGLNMDDYEGIAITGNDGYYCLYPQDVIAATSDFMIAVKMEGKPEMDKEFAPAMVGAQGQMGPYWVKKVNHITLYDNIPEKDIQNVWVFSNLAKGIDTVQFDYYGSMDDFINLEQIWARLDDVDIEGFFTMKSSDGFSKNEAMNLVIRDYYIKINGVDAPTNINASLILGMNVQHIAWFSANADACVFPEEFMKYLTVVQDGEISGVSLSDVLSETQVKMYAEDYYELVGTEGESEIVAASELENAILYAGKDGQYGVHWVNGAKYDDIANLMRVRKSAAPAAQETVPVEPEKTTVAAAEQTTVAAPEKTTAAAPEQTTVAVAEQTTVAEPEKTTAAEPEKTIVGDPKKTAAPEPEKTTAPEPEKTTAPEPKKTTAPEPEKTTAPEPEKTTAPEPEKTTAPEPEAPAAVLPAGFPAPAAGEEPVLKITGDGVQYNCELTLSQLQALKDGYHEGVYSLHNSFPTNKTAVAKGVDLAYLLKQLGLKDNAAIITFIAADGYTGDMTVPQLLQTRYYYPKAAKGSDSGAKSVPPVLAWAYKSGATDMSKAKDCDLTFVVGQNGINEVNTGVSVQDIVEINVVCGSVPQWSKPEVTFVELENGNLSVSLESDEIDGVKYYYTLDGSDPTVASALYNPSNSFFQPQLTVPIEMKADQTLKVLGSGLGMTDSDILVWTK